MRLPFLTALGVVELHGGKQQGVLDWVEKLNVI